MGMFDYVKVDPRLNVPGATSSMSVWQTKCGPECMGLFRLSPDECTYTYAKDLGGASPKPTYKILNMDIHFYRLEGGEMAEYDAKIIDGELVSITTEDNILVWSRTE